MQGATASNETLGGVGTDGVSQASPRVARRRLGLIALVAVVAFGAAFAIGAASKKHDAQQAPAQLAPSTSVQGAHTVGVTAVSANAAIPDLKSPPPPKHKPKPKPTTSSSTSSSTVVPTQPSTPSSPGTGGSQSNNNGTMNSNNTDDGGTVNNDSTVDNSRTTNGNTVGSNAISDGSGA